MGSDVDVFREHQFVLMDRSTNNCPNGRLGTRWGQSSHCVDEGNTGVATDDPAAILNAVCSGQFCEVIRHHCNCLKSEWSAVPFRFLCGRIHLVSPTEPPKEKEETKGIH